MISLKRYRNKPDTITKLQQDIRNEKHALIHMAESFQDGVQLIDPYENGYPILYVNKAFTKMTGYKNDEVVGLQQNFAEGTQTDQQAARKIINAMEYEQNTTVEILNYHQDGTAFWKEMNINPLYCSDDTLFAFITIQKNITHKKEVMVEDRASIFESSLGRHKNFITFINMDGYHKEVNKAHPGLVKIDDESILGKHITHAVMEEDLEKVTRSFASARNGNIENITVRILDEGLEVVELDLFYLPAYKNGEIIGVYSVYKNVSSQKKSTKLITYAEKYEAVKNTAFHIGEDLHYPLTALNGFTQLLQASNDGNQAYINLIQGELSRLEQIKNSIKLFVHPHAVTYKRLNIHYLLEQASDALYALFISHFIEVRWSYRASSKYIYGDKDKLIQVFILLLKNAIEASEERSERFIHIEVEDKNHSYISIKVIDEGHGISEDDLPKVFKPFYTTKQYGVGLGLTICHQIIQEHDGKISFKSKSGKGTEVAVVLPIEKSETKH